MSAHESPLSACDVATYFLANADHEAGDSISNLKLQKLLYYAQGFHLAMQDGDAMFREPVEAWDLGPVVPSIYHQYKGYRWQGIDTPSQFDPDNYLPEDREILDAVMAVYGQFSARRLSDMTHLESPWMETPRNEEIPLWVMRNFFSQMVEAGRQGEAIPGEPVWPTHSFRFQNRKKIAARLRRHVPWLSEIARSRPSVETGWAEDEDWSEPSEPQ